ncbi:ABC transporter substrate-binding protein [Cereibacter johrii]|uniref:Iron complex transport system substrate-binding protein n=1 Tax=Cereibacter johrii TaxID=445629 RepID=A0ABX5J6G6_9RHOB|nr:ABC transporter substrate-binding protein [Cereibacter johrii]ODM43308.1 ABC transporter substrate-binding protein [Cereibacter johrii]PTM75573.1 iron complex transport system substrate-binding protein [Cereibacter johrii]
MISRRPLLAGLLALTLPVPARAAAGPRLAVIDWAAAETLIALDRPPLAISDSGYFASRMPFDLPPGVVDIGPFWEISLEYLARLAPDRIIAPASALMMTPRIAEIAPVDIVPTETRGSRLDLAADLARQMAAVAGLAPESAARLVEGTEAALAAAGRRAGRSSVLVCVPDLSGRLFTLYGRGSLPDAVLARMGLANAWTGPVTALGTYRASLEELIGMEEATILLVEIASMRPRTERMLRTSALWRAVPAVASGRAHWIGNFYPQGGLLSARHLAGTVAAALTQG